MRYRLSPGRTTYVARQLDAGVVVTGIGVMVGGMIVATGVVGMAVGTGVGVGIVNWALQTGPVVIFIHETLGIVSF